MLPYISSFFGSKPDNEPQLTLEQKRLYASERMMNFRGIAKLCATRSQLELTAQNLASLELQLELADLGEFAEVAFAAAAWLFDDMDLLTRPNYPLEGYEALRQAKLLASFEGSSANVPAYVAYRPGTKQLVVGFSGTGTIKQTLLDMCAHMTPHPAGRGCSVHYGFWTMYKKYQSSIREALQNAWNTYHITEVVSVGHSMGAALCYLLALDLIDPESEYTLPPSLGITVAAFGGPRVGNAILHERWQRLKQKYLAANALNSIREFSVRTNNDGVPTLPPIKFGYAHLALEPLYLYHGRLFYIPPSEREHSIFAVSSDALDPSRPPDHPRGGHHYYNGRSFERTVRRMRVLINAQKDHPNDWASIYEQRIFQLEAGEDLAKSRGRLAPSTDEPGSHCREVMRALVIPETEPLRGDAFGRRLRSLVQRPSEMSRLGEVSGISRRIIKPSARSGSQSPVSQRGSLHLHQGSSPPSHHNSSHSSLRDAGRWSHTRIPPRSPANQTQDGTITGVSRESSRHSPQALSVDID